MTRARYSRNVETKNTNGHYCPKCKKLHLWPMYVFAHYSLALKHTCDCGQVVTLQNGRVTI
jgi:hypothetical protein